MTYVMTNLSTYTYSTYLLPILRAYLNFRVTGFYKIIPTM